MHNQISHLIAFFGLLAIGLMSLPQNEITINWSSCAARAVAVPTALPRLTREASENLNSVISAVNKGSCAAFFAGFLCPIYAISRCFLCLLMIVLWPFLYLVLLIGCCVSKQPFCLQHKKYCALQRRLLADAFDFRPWTFGCLRQAVVNNRLAVFRSLQSQLAPFFSVSLQNTPEGVSQPVLRARADAMTLSASQEQMDIKGVDNFQKKMEDIIKIESAGPEAFGVEVQVETQPEESLPPPIGRKVTSELIPESRHDYSELKSKYLLSKGSTGFFMKQTGLTETGPGVKNQRNFQSEISQNAPSKPKLETQAQSLNFVKTASVETAPGAESQESKTDSSKKEG